MRLWPIQVMDPELGFALLERKLPHSEQLGTVCFITWRTPDSIPAATLKTWLCDRDLWLRKHNINAKDASWENQVRQLEDDPIAEFVRIFSERRQRELDNLHGKCLFKNPELAQVVSDSLLKFDGDRYEITDFVVMPNHVHLLATFENEDAMRAQCATWIQEQSTELNSRLGLTGDIWLQDGFDQQARSQGQFEMLGRYIATNPNKAHLGQGESLHYAKAKTR